MFRAALALGGLAVAIGCPPPNRSLPEIEVRGDAAAGFRIDGWTASRSMGVVVKWTATVTRGQGPELDGIAYRLIDPRGRELSAGTVSFRSAYDYSEPFLAGHSFTLSIPAYRGESTGNHVARIALELRTTPESDEPVLPIEQELGAPSGGS